MLEPHPETIHVSAPGAALTSAIKAMTSRSWKVLHQEAWRKLTLEEERRGRGLTEATIQITRQAWNKLPDTIRGYISVKEQLSDAVQKDGRVRSLEPTQ